MKNASTGKTAANRTDWDKVRKMSDADITHDADSPATTASDWEGAVIKRAGKVIGHVNVRGPQKNPTKVPTAIRLSPEVVEYFRSTGAGWQTRIDDVLKDWVAAHS